GRPAGSATIAVMLYVPALPAYRNPGWAFSLEMSDAPWHHGAWPLTTMFFYEILLVTGALGLIAMALVGFVHAGGPHHSGHTGGAHGGHALQVGRLGHGSHTGHAAGGVARHGAGHPARATASPGEQRGALGRSVL